MTESVSGNRMNPLNRLLILVLSVFLLCTACSSRMPYSGTYVFDELRWVKIDLALKRDGTYQASLHSMPSQVQHESGTWKMEGVDIVLAPVSGELHHPVRRLRPDEQRKDHLVWVPPDKSVRDPATAGGTIAYFTFRPR